MFCLVITDIRVNSECSVCDVSYQHLPSIVTLLKECIVVSIWVRRECSVCDVTCPQ